MNGARPFALVATLLSLLAQGVNAQAIPNPCEELALGNPVDKYLGRTMSFLGTVLSTSSRIEGGKSIQVVLWACKTTTGEMTKAEFGTESSDSTWTSAANGANKLKDLLRVSGILKERSIAQLGAAPHLVPFIGKARVELASESK